MGKLKELYIYCISPLVNSFRNHNFLMPKHQEKCDIPVGESIYPMEGIKTKGEATKHYNKFHFLFKYKCFVPAINLLYIFFGKYLPEKVSDKWYDQNIKIMWDSWEDATELMSQYFNPVFRSHRSYMICKKIMAAQALNDSATREFVNLWMHSIYGRMQKAYGGRGRVCHVLYTAHSCYHPAYFTLAQLVMKGAIKPEDITGPELEGGSALPIVPPVPKHFNVNICPPFLKKFLMCYDLFFKKGIRIDIDMVPDESHAGKIGLGPKDKENLKKKKKAKK